MEGKISQFMNVNMRMKVRVLNSMDWPIC